MKTRVFFQRESKYQEKKREISFELFQNKHFIKNENYKKYIGSIRNIKFNVCNAIFIIKLLLISVRIVKLIHLKVTVIFQGYGLTETSSVAFVENGKKFSSIGKIVDGTQARLVNIETQQDVDSHGETGELWIKGPHIMKGYLNDEVATKATLTEDKWLKTGDIAYFDEDYDFFITDRLKELIKVKGFQVKVCSDMKRAFFYVHIYIQIYKIDR